MKSSPPFVAAVVTVLAYLAIPPVRAVADPASDSTAVDGGGGSSYSNADLAATTGAPWIPARPVLPARPWESVLRFPGRVVSLPLTLLSPLAEDASIYFETAGAGHLYSLIRAEAFGLSAGNVSLSEVSGLGGELRWAPPPLGHHLEAAIAGSLQKYDRKRVTAGAGPLWVTWLEDWRPGERYFGRGPNAPLSGESSYGVRVQSVRASLSFRGRDGAWAPLERGKAALAAADLDRLATRDGLTLFAGPREARVMPGGSQGRPSFELPHPEDAAGSLGVRVEHFTYGVRLQRDVRQGRPRFASGWRASLEAERRGRAIRALALRDAGNGAASFTRITGGFETNHSFGRDPRTFRLALTAIDQRRDRAGGLSTIDDLVTLGGSRLSGFDPGRFHDVDLALARLSYLFPLLKNAEFDLHAETGSVFPSFESARLRQFSQSFGFALRFRAGDLMYGAIGMDFSRETARLRFALGSVE